MALSVSNIFQSNTKILASEVNQNFSDIVVWANGNITNSSFGTMLGEIEWSISSNVLAIDITNSGTEGSISATQSGILASGKSVVKIVASGSQTAGAAALDVSLSGVGATIPVASLTNAGTGHGTSLSQNGILAANKSALNVSVSAAQTTGKAASYVELTDASSSIPLLKGENAGSGNLLELGQSGADKLIVNSAGVLSQGGVVSAQYLNNLSVTASVSSSALTILLKGADGADLSSTSAGSIGFRSATLTSGAPAVRSLTSNPSLTISSGSTLGTVSATACDIYVYALDNAGTVELAASMKLLDEGRLVSTTAEGGAGSADSSVAIYSTTARSTVACRLLARITSTQTTAGTWNSAVSEIAMVPFMERRPYAIATTNASQAIGASLTVVNFEDVDIDLFSRITTGAGWTYTADRPGIYRVSYHLQLGGNTLTTSGVFGSGVYVNGSARNSGSSMYGNGASIQMTSGASALVRLVPGDTIQVKAAVSGGTSLSGDSTYNWIQIQYAGYEAQ